MLERLVIDEIVLCWIDLAVAPSASSIIQCKTEGRHRTLLRHINGCQRRYLRAIKTLAQIRKLGPKIQVNVQNNGVFDANVLLQGL